MHIGLYFGSFNPIHTGHLIVANHILEYTDVDKVWFVVSPHNPLKDSHALLNEYDRLHLVNLAIEGNNKFRASNVEFQLPKPSYTVHTMAYLCEKFPLEHFSIIMGTDSFQNIPRWKNYEQLTSNYKFILYNRPGFKVEETYDASISIVDAPLLQLSSTYIRQQVREKKSIRYIVPQSVEEYILANRYYQK